jgi:hypothetical protein
VTVGGIWQVLEIERTADLLQIRRAYARKLKLTNPEDDAEAFAHLRAAYEAAMSYAQNLQRRSAVPTPPSANEPDARSEPPPAAPTEAIAPGEPRPARLPVLDEPPLPREVPAPPAPPSPLETLQRDFAMLDQAVVSGRSDTDEVPRLLERCLSSEALSNVHIQLQFEHTVAGWLLARVPATNALFAIVAERLQWQRREGSLGVPPEISRALAHLRALDFWAREQKSSGGRGRARAALTQPPHVKRWRWQIFFRNLDLEVKTLLGEVLGTHQSLLMSLNGESVQWWRKYLSERRFTSRQLRTMVGYGAFALVFCVLLFVASDPAVQALARVALCGFAGLLAAPLIRVFGLENLKRRFQAKYRARVPTAIRLGALPAACGVLLLSALLPSHAWASLISGFAGLACVVWALIVTSPPIRWSKQFVQLSLLVNVVLVGFWWIAGAGAQSGLHVLSSAMWPALFCVLMVERMSIGTWLGAYRHGKTPKQHLMICLGLAGAAALSMALATVVTARWPWLGLDLSLMTAVVLALRVVTLSLSRNQLKFGAIAAFLALMVTIGVVFGKEGPGDPNRTDLRSFQLLIETLQIFYLCFGLMQLALVGFNIAGDARKARRPQG